MVQKMKLQKNRIDIWRVKLNLKDSEVNVLRCILSEDEQNRANSYKFFKQRKLFILSRVRLRQILSMYLGVIPERIIFNYGSQGKPFLPQSHNGEGISFNLSHSGEMSVYAVGTGIEMGIDIEKPDKKVNFLNLAKRYFTEMEYNPIMSLPEGERLKAFYRCWTRKEAYIKGKGSGIAKMLDKTSVSCLPGEPSKLLANSLEPHDIYSWTIEDLNIGVPYIGAIAYKGKGMDLKYYTY